MNGHRSLLTFICFAGVLVMSNGCAKIQAEDPSVQMQAYRLIDSARADEAIALCERHLAANPDDDEIRLTLASAFARKAGFRIQALIPVFLAVKSSVDTYQNEEKNRKDTSQTEEHDADQASIRSASTVFLRAKGLAEGFAYLPTIGEDAIVYLNHAIQLLEETKKPSQSLALYRGVLRTLKLKFVLANYVAHLTEAPKADDAKAALKRFDRSFTICGLNTDELDRLFQEAGRLSLEILTDHALANPDQETANAAHRQEIELELRTWSEVRRAAEQPTTSTSTPNDAIQKCRQHEALKNLAALFSSLH